MANRAWRNELDNRNYVYGSNYGGQMGYQGNYNDRRYNTGGYRDDYARGRKRDFPNRFDGGNSPKRGRDNQGNSRRNFTKSSNVRYNVKVPKHIFNLKEGTYSNLKSRYSRLYVPSDFFHSDFRWQDVFQLHTPVQLGNKTSYQIFNKEVNPVGGVVDTISDPSDANYIYSAKVMLISQASKDDLLKHVTEGTSNIARSIQFLVGTKGKNEKMAIGGPWSPSLDGTNPDEDPQVLINTAIRTCKQLTGIDLSSCKEWHRFVEFHYYRASDRQGLNASSNNVEADTEKSKSENDYRVETVVIFVPSVWDCMPNQEDWDNTKKMYTDSLDAILNPPLPEPAVEILDEIENKEEEEKPQESEKTEKEEKEETTESTEATETKEEVKPMEIETVSATTQETVDKNEPKILDEKDRKRLERLYKPVENPAIVVHPNREAKNGKFDCQLMSLHSMLEYRSDDQKEYVFEVSVFAEQFFEMIQRDSAFKIYKTLLMVPSSAEIKEVESTDNGDKSKAGLDSDYLMAFSVFDNDHSGYIKDHDLEEIMHSIGLDLSKSQAKKLINKASSNKNTFNYKDATIQENLNTLTDLELSKGNKVNLRRNDENLVVYTDDKISTMSKVKKIETEIKQIESVFQSNKKEIDSVRFEYHSAMDKENELRCQLKNLENQLYDERKNVRDATQLQGLYNSLLSMSRDVLDRAKNKIDRQFEKDAEKAKAREEVVSTTDVRNGSVE